MVYIVDTCTTHEQFNGVYRRTMHCSKGLIVYIVEHVQFKVFNCGYRRTCTVQSV